MASGFDLLEAAASGFEDRHRAWDFVRGFIAAWHRPLATSDGWSPLELQTTFEEVTARFPTVNRLPTALVETYALVGRRRDLTSNQDRLLAPNELRLDHSGEVLIVRRENQGCAQWGIRLADLSHDDPPVVMQVAGSEHGWRPYADRWSHACVEMVLFESLWTRAELSFDVELDDYTMAAVEQRFAPLAVPALPHWTLPEVRWFAGPDVLLRDEARTWLWVRTRHHRALDSARQALTK
jgi:hypothetical protein